MVIRIGTERRNIFGTEIKGSVAPGPGIYEVSSAAKLAKGKISPKITIGKKVNESIKLANLEALPGPGTYDISNEKEKKKKSYSIGLRYTN